MNEDCDKRAKILDRAIRRLISDPAAPTVTREQVDAVLKKYPMEKIEVYGLDMVVTSILADLGIKVKTK